MKNGVKHERKHVGNGSFAQDLPCGWISELYAGHPQQRQNAQGKCSITIQIRLSNLKGHPWVPPQSPNTKDEAHSHIQCATELKSLTL